MEVVLRAWMPDTSGDVWRLAEAVRALGGDVLDIEVRSKKSAGHMCTRCDHPAANHGWEFSPGFVEVKCKADRCECEYRDEVRGLNT